MRILYILVLTTTLSGYGCLSYNKTLLELQERTQDAFEAATNNTEEVAQ